MYYDIINFVFKQQCQPPTERNKQKKNSSGHSRNFANQYFDKIHIKVEGGYNGPRI